MLVVISVKLRETLKENNKNVYHLKNIGHTDLICYTCMYKAERQVYIICYRDCLTTTDNFSSSSHSI